jgi:hypothetical protein
MIRILLHVALILLLPVSVLFGQDFGIKFSGFVKSDYFYDSRQTVSIREGHFLLYPAGKNIDAEKADLNSQGSLNFLSIQTRLSGAISAPDAFSAKISGVLEADFFGNENANFVDANGFRLRHAYVKLTWPNTELLIGQYWHPFFVPACFSEVISFNTGAPMQPFSRNPQMRILRKLGSFRLIAAAVSQRDFTSGGGSAPLRNSVMPDLNAQLHFTRTAADGKKEFLIGAGANYKTLLPLLQTTKGDNKYKTNETVSGLSTMAFMKYKTPSISFKIQGVYGQNLYDLTMLGGYAVSAVIDTAKNTVNYTTVNNYSVWSECIFYGSTKVQYALWAGYTENLGSQDSIFRFSNQVDGKDVTVRGASADNSSDIKSIFRISPRVVVVSGSLTFAFETEYTSVAYAKKKDTGVLYRDDYGKITKTENVANWRLLLSTILKF